jgi:hypothetical protein
LSLVAMRGWQHRVHEKEVMEWKSIFLECDENCDQIVTMKARVA